MGRAILVIDLGYNREQVLSFKCKSEIRAQEIADKRPNCKSWKFYENNIRIPQPKKNIKQYKEPTLESMEMEMRKVGLI